MNLKNRSTHLMAFLLLGALAGIGCANVTQTVPDFGQNRLKLVDGSPISDAAYDDYSPIIVRLSNNYLALVFASTRTCSVSCAFHNIFIASSVTAYTDNGVLPAFNPPQVITANASPINNSTPWRLAVSASGTNITVYAQSPGGQISTTGAINPVSAAPINVGAMLSPITEYNCYSNNMLGLDATGLMIAANPAGTQVFRFNPNTVGGGSCGSVSNTQLSIGMQISLMRTASTGIADGYIVSDTFGTVTAQSATSFGPMLQVLVSGLAAKKLISTGVSVMQGATAAGDLITFSAAAGFGQKSDLYVLLSPTPAALWQQYVPFGQQPTP